MTPTDESHGDAAADSDAGGHGSDDGARADRGAEADRRRKRRAAVRPHETGPVPDRDAAGADAPDEEDDWTPEGVDPDDLPWYFQPMSVSDPDIPPVVDRIGSLGIGLVAIAFGLAVVGVGAVALGVQPYGNAMIAASLGLGALSMVFGMVFQSFVTDLLPRSK